MAPAGLTLVTGGARAGKTAFALQLAHAHPGPVVYLATAEARDREMEERIRRHRAERPSHWRTVEAPLDVASALAGTPPGALVLLDCLTLWVTNQLLAGLPADQWLPPDGEALSHQIVSQAARLVAWCSSAGLAMIAVSNEVGLGIVPADPLSRLYRDTLGRVNQFVAARADRAFLVVAGLALDLKAAGAVAVRPEELGNDSVR